VISNESQKNGRDEEITKVSVNPVQTPCSADSQIIIPAVIRRMVSRANAGAAS
jgi:hypothetical protein